MVKANELRIEKIHVPGGALVRLVGDLDASVREEDLGSDLAGAVVFDLDGVKRITSFGVREWVAAMASLSVDACCFINARPSAVAQLNMVSGFAGPATVVSLYLPYACDACDAETDILVDLRGREGRALLHSGTPTEVVKCGACGADAEFDDVAESYLSFAVSQGALSLPPTLDAFVDRAMGKVPNRSSEAFRVQKEVTARVTGLWLQGPVSAKARFRRLADGLEGKVVVVLAGVTHVEDGGARRLLELASAPDADVLWARVPLSLFETDREPVREMLRGRVASVLVPSPCPVCTEVNDVEIDFAAAREGGSGVIACARCRATSGGAERAFLDRSLDLLAQQVAPEVIRYLEEHPGRALPDVGHVEVTHGITASRPLPGSISSRYEIVRPLGRGGMAEVFLAKQRGPEGFVKQVALKRILPELAANEHFSQLLLQEARVAAAITHPNVVQIFDLGREDDAYFIAMELVNGWDLRTVLSAAREGDVSLPVELACRVAADICAGLHAAHTCSDDEGVELEIVHRDISPHNVLLSLNGAVKLTDFGVSKVAHSLIESRSGNLKGKVIYMAPEQIDPNLGDVDARTDLWAVGVVLWEMLVGTPLFRRDSEYTSMFAVLNEEIPRARLRRADVPAALDDTIARCVCRDSSQRFSSARELQLELETTLVGLGRAATAAHLSQWLDQLAQRSFDNGVRGPLLLTPTSSTASLDGSDTLHGTLRQAIGDARSGGRGSPQRDDEGDG